MRIGDGLHQLEHDRIEEDKARLLKQAAAELLGRFDGRVKDAIGELRKRALRLSGDESDFALPRLSRFE